MRWRTTAASILSTISHTIPLAPYTVWLAIGCFALTFLSIYWNYVCDLPADWIADMDQLGKPQARRIPGTVIVCGGSITGIVTARICADHFERVIVVDPEIQVIGKPKTRILQYNASHRTFFFLSLFLDGVRRLWPNFDDKVIAAGARIGSSDFQIHYSGIRVPTPSHCLRQVLVARRSLVQEILFELFNIDCTSRNINTLAGTVRGVEFSSDGTSISTVVVRTLKGQHVSLGDIALVADCTGIAQAGFKWLRNTLPNTLRCSYKGNFQYLTIYFTVPKELAATLPIPSSVPKDATVTYGYGTHFEPTVAFGLTFSDNDQIQVGVSCCENIPRTPGEVIPFLMEIRGHAPIPVWVLETIRMLCDQCEATVDHVKIPTLSYIQYQNGPPDAIPSNFIAVGDAEMNLNPIHGQGFSKVILNGLTLNNLLGSVQDKIPKGFSAQYFKKNAARTQGLWYATRLHDYGSESCEPMAGETRNKGRILRWFELKLLSAAIQYDDVAAAMWTVRHLLADEKIMLAPRLLWKILITPSRF
ncbi:hypothetical protein C8J57DRAFT_1493802 [Mycena rebaudengoi]|nr:hypothetical protein C8J57DRAFT_1493802 [Mycena rebaudengoi]